MVGSRGKKLGSTVLETNGRVLVEHMKGLSGTLHVCLEEGCQSGWLAEILSPHVDELVVAAVTKSRGSKDDKIDAFALAEKLRNAAVGKPVFKHVGRYGTLRQLVKVHDRMVRDTVRVQNGIKALFRSRGIRVVGKGVYRPAERSVWLEALPSSCRVAARLLYEEYDALTAIRSTAEKELVAESHRHRITRLLETCPGMGKIRVAQFVAVVVTPYRFRTRTQLWAYCGLAVVTRSSSDWVQLPNGRWQRAKVQQTRGLNRSHNHMLKDVFKGAATTVVAIHRDCPLGQDYQRLLDGGTKPNLAKLTLARKIAATTLAMWKNQEGFNPQRSVNAKE
jgi:transposase